MKSLYFDDKAEAIAWAMSEGPLPAPNGRLYFIATQHHFKVGRSRRVFERIKEQAYGSAIIVIGPISGNHVAEEKWFHKNFGADKDAVAIPGVVIPWRIENYKRNDKAEAEVLSWFEDGYPMTPRFPLSAITKAEAKAK